MKEVTYYRDGDVVVFVNPNGVPLRCESAVYDNARWVLTDSVFQIVRKQNPDVTFVEKPRQ